MKMTELKRKAKKLKNLYVIYYKLIGQKRERQEVENKKRELQENGGNVLVKVDEALKNTGITYFADFGTLLGLVRDNAFMKWDSDMDFGVLSDGKKNEADMWNALENALKNVGLRKKKTCTYDGRIIEQTYSRGVLTIDFFLHFFTENNDNVYLAYKKKSYDYTQDNEYHLTLLKMYRFGKSEIRDFNGIKVSVPYKAESYLASVYSETWRIPNPNWISEKGPAWNEIPNAKAYAEYFD